MFIECLWPQFDIWKFLPILIDWGVKRRRNMLTEGVREEEGERRMGVAC